MFSSGPAGHYCDYGEDDQAPEKVTGSCPDKTMSLNTGKFGSAHSRRPIEPVAGDDHFRKRVLERKIILIQSHKWV